MSAVSLAHNEITHVNATWRIAILLLSVFNQPVGITYSSNNIYLIALADADPLVLNVDNQSGWGTYYDSRPAVVAVNLSEAMAVAVCQKIYSHLISLYQDRIKSTALMIEST